jgi:hypothetical protein
VPSFFVTLCLLAQPGTADDAGLEFFETRIRPVLVRQCYECHSSASPEPKGGLLLDNRDRARRGGESGPAVVPGNVDESLLIAAIKHDSFEMPPDGRLPDRVVLDFVKWIEIGAPDPRDKTPDPDDVAAQHWEALFQKRREWWSLQPVTNPSIPDVETDGWSDGTIDRFILQKLEANDLEPAPPADRSTLVRRLAFAITGLPPVGPRIDAFFADTSPLAWDRLVDHFLASPHFGERWARHWMDVVRYADTYGYEWDIPVKGSWHYRDYLTRAFNQDVPIDRLFREQIAGDLLEHPRIDPVEWINESLIGPLFFQMGEKRHGDSAEFIGIEQEMIDNKIDAFSKAFQALTVACARCHDHKLDPISQRDYYALAGVFMSSRWITNTVDLPGRNATLLDELKSLKTKLHAELAALWSAESKVFAQKLLDAVSRVAASPGTPAPSALAGKETPWRLLLKARLEKAPTIEDPLFTWIQVTNTVASGKNVEESWRDVAHQYADESRRRMDENAKNFKIIADFRQGIPDGWSVDGAGLREVVRCGDFSIAVDGDEAVRRLLPGGLFTGALSTRLNGAVRTPALRQFKESLISFEYTGGDFAAHRTVVDNAFLTERQRYLKKNDPEWLRLRTKADSQDRYIFIEFATKTSNPNFPPRVGLGGKCSNEQIADPRSWFGLTRVAIHETDASPQDELARFTPLFAGASPKTLDDVARRYAQWFGSALHAWREGTAAEEDVRLINWLVANGLVNNRYGEGQTARVNELVSLYRETESRVATPRTVNGMLDQGVGYDYRLNIRGEYDQLGDAIPRRFLRVLSGTADGFDTSGSGRRELARLVTDANNPITARVFVNRVWHWLFGTGLVATPSNFGLLGERPSHPELLDDLARRFVSEGWSLKRLLRRIVRTNTWQQSARTTERSRAVDPYNRLLSHYPLRRLEAEVIRDAILVTSGRLDPQLFGPPVDPHRENEDPQKRLFSGPLDGNRRRSIYTKVTIMEPPRFLATFNQPDPKIPTGARDVTTSVAQSLALLNDPFVTEQAEEWARTLIADGRTDPKKRVTEMFRRALGRKPSALETERWVKVVDDFAAAHGVSDGERMGNSSVWKEVAHAIYNLKEFIYLR